MTRSSRSQGVAQLDETIWTLASDIDNHHGCIMQSLKDFNVHKSMAGGVGSHLHSPIPKSGYCRVHNLAEKPLDVVEIVKPGLSCLT